MYNWNLQKLTSISICSRNIKHLLKEYNSTRGNCLFLEWSHIVTEIILSKNILGAFYLPKLAFCVNEWLLTISSSNAHAAVGEATKTNSCLSRHWGFGTKKTIYWKNFEACRNASETGWKHSWDNLSFCVKVDHLLPLVSSLNQWRVWQHHEFSFEIC